MSNPFRIVSDPDEGTLVRDVVQSRVTVRLTRGPRDEPGRFTIEAEETGFPPHFLVVIDSVADTIRLLSNLINRIMLADMTEDDLLGLDFAQHQLATTQEACRMVDQSMHPSGARTAIFKGGSA